MTYRDDRDATLARAEALQLDLSRAEAERDRLRAQVERLEKEHANTPPAVAPSSVPTMPPVQAIVRAHTHALTPTEIQSLLAEVEWGFGRRRADLRILKVVFAAMLVGSVPLYFTVPLMGAMCTFGGIVGLIESVFVAAMSDASEVLGILRDRPNEILELVEGKYTLTIVTRTKSAAYAGPDQAGLLARLARYCPEATARRRGL